MDISYHAANKFQKKLDLGWHFHRRRIRRKWFASLFFTHGGWRRLKWWYEQGALLDTWQKILALLDKKSRLKWEEGFGDGTFSPAKKRGEAAEKTKKGKGTKIT